MPAIGLVEQPAPGGVAGHFLLVQQLFQLVRQLVGTEHAQVAQPGPPVGQRAIGELGLQCASSSRFSSRAKNSRWLLIVVTRSVTVW